MKLPLPERQRKRFVIDADVAKAASPSNSPVPGRCFDFLVALQQCHHKVVFSNRLWGEWLNHHSRYSMAWMREMRGRKLVVRIPDPTDTVLREKINRMAESTAVLDAMNKDVHLLEAALRADEIVTSMDNRARRHFAAVSEQIDSIRDIAWVNPDADSEYCLAWLKRGAPIEEKRQLGYQHRPR